MEQGDGLMPCVQLFLSHSVQLFRVSVLGGYVWGVFGEGTQTVHQSGSLWEKAYPSIHLAVHPPNHPSSIRSRSQEAKERLFCSTLALDSFPAQMVCINLAGSSTWSLLYWLFSTQAFLWPSKFLTSTLRLNPATFERKKRHYLIILM